MEGEGHQGRGPAKDNQRDQYQLAAAGPVKYLTHERLAEAIYHDAQAGGDGYLEPAPAELGAHWEHEDTKAVAGAYGHETDEDGGGTDVPAIEDGFLGCFGGLHQGTDIL